MQIDSAIPDDEILDILCEVTGLPDLEKLPDLDLFEEGLLDSLALVKLLVELANRYDIQLMPADIRREEWATPRLVLQSVRANLPA